MQLRKHQIKAIGQIKESIRQGYKSIMLAAPCAFGKTVVAGQILKGAQDKNKRGIFIADRVKLVTQTEDCFETFGIDYGVQMSNHYKTNEEKLIQIASVQTLARRFDNKFDYDIAIIDEAHTNYEIVKKAMKINPNCIYIGMSATPYAKGLGITYKKLIVPTTTQELLDQGFLTPIQYYGGQSINLDNMKARALNTGGSDYDFAELSFRTEKEKERLSGDLVKNYLEHGEGKVGIAFSPSIRHSEYLTDLFNKYDIPTAHIDGYMEESERRKIYKLYQEGRIKILSCSRLLGVGFDHSECSVLLDCYPTKSHIVYQQRLGRITRLHENKPYAIYLDHAGNTSRFGFYESIVPGALHTDESFREKNQVKRKKKDIKTHLCPDCKRIFSGVKCECGYTIDMKRVIMTDTTMLKRLNKAQKNNLLIDQATKSRWYNQLKLYEAMRGYKKGFAENIYKKKFSVYPNNIKSYFETRVDDDVRNYVKSCFIAYSRKNKS